jgi:hypothetical protein
VENDEIITVRVPGSLKRELEKKRKRMSKSAGVEVKASAVIRAILERGLLRGARAKRVAA